VAADLSGVDEQVRWMLKYAASSLAISVAASCPPPPPPLRVTDPMQASILRARGISDSALPTPTRPAAAADARGVVSSPDAMSPNT
jgi:hypothetical protein